MRSFKCFRLSVTETRLQEKEHQLSNSRSIYEEKEKSMRNRILDLESEVEELKLSASTKEAKLQERINDVKNELEMYALKPKPHLIILQAILCKLFKSQGTSPCRRKRFTN